MIKNILCLMLMASGTFCSAQIKFELGYFIDNEGKRVDCLIKNLDWKNNPKQFNYKLDASSSQQNIKIANVCEFGISNISKYIRAEVEIDRSSEDLGDLSKQRAPEYQVETLFLKVLIEGKASLFSYYHKNLTRFFFSVDESSIQQLVYKTYQVSDLKVRESRLYRNQLWNSLKCDGIAYKEYRDLNYGDKELNSLFRAYNMCQNSEFIDFNAKNKKKPVNLSIRPGFGFSSLSIENDVARRRNVDFSSSVNFRLGLEMEFVLPFKNGKWAVLVEPTYSSYQSDGEASSQSVSASYNLIELPIGARYYSFLDANSRVFFNGTLVFGLPVSSEIDYANDGDVEISHRSVNFAVGAGYSYKHKYSLEVRYGLGREILGDFVSFNSDYTNLSLILGYRLSKR